MEHPVFHHRSYIYLYYSFWSTLIVCQSVIVSLQYDQDLLPSFLDAFCGYMIYSFLGLALWYPTSHFNLSQRIDGYFSGKEKFDLNVVINFASISIASVSIWVASSYYISINLGNESYTEFAESIFSLRIVGGVFLYMFIHMDYHLLAYNRMLAERDKREAQLFNRLKDAELNMLKSQINPHFLFNSLNSISSLTMYEADKAQAMIIKLSDYLRYSVSSGKTTIGNLKNELENIKRYMDIEKIRFGSRLEYLIDIDQSLMDFEIPTMILQPLFENAVKHGVYESTETVTVKCSAKITKHNDREMLEISIQNDFDPQARVKKGTGTGLKNIAERLRLIYGTSQLLKTKKTDTHFKASLLLPEKQLS